jgi:hypothetical protein
MRHDLRLAFFILVVCFVAIVYFGLAIWCPACAH